MPYREKSAWLALAAIVLTFTPYFGIVIAGVLPAQPMPDLRQLGLYAVAAVARMLILGIGTLALRRNAPEEARLPLDERDLTINRRAMSVAYYVLMAGMILVGCVMPFVASGWDIVNAGLAMIVAAELVNYGLVVASYRRQL